MNTQSSRLLTWSLIVAIVVVLNLLFSQVVRVAFVTPEYNTFCSAQPSVSPVNEAECVTTGGKWNPTPADPTTPKKVSGYCDMYYMCNQEYTAAQKVFDKNAFLVRIALAALALVLAYTLKIANPVSLGLAWGGVVALIWSSASYWNELGDLVRLLMLLVLLGILIYFGIKKFGKSLQ